MEEKIYEYILLFINYLSLLLSFLATLFERKLNEQFPFENASNLTHEFLCGNSNKNFDAFSKQISSFIFLQKDSLKKKKS